MSLSQVNKDWDECKTELERRLYLIKNMENLNKNSKPYKSGEYEEMFNASELAFMAAEDIVEYKTSILAEMERESELEYAKEEGIEKGIVQGIEKGIVQGIEKGKLEVAQRMKNNGFAIGDIMLATGLTEQQVESL